MNHFHLCPTCKTGQLTYLQDNRSPFCLYLNCHNGTTCTMYRPIEQSDFENIESTEITILPINRVAAKLQKPIFPSPHRCRRAIPCLRPKLVRKLKAPHRTHDVDFSQFLK